jgi:succinate-semialdehyde dehydrogenase / glutarate-semialdehyde dehydrogenase
MPIVRMNPTTGKTLRTYEELSEAQVDAKLDLAQRAFRAHRLTTFAQRAQGLVRAAELLEAEKTTLARTMTDEMGKPITGALAEIDKCSWVCRFYAENAERFLADEVITTDFSRSFTRCLPLGAVLAVMPWNFPFWQVFRFAAPALMAGNVGLLKHASNVPGSALAIEDIFRRAGFAEGVFQTLLIGARKVERVLGDDRVAAATLTGSESAGSQVASLAGKHIKKTVMELGGSDPFIVMASAQIPEAAKVAAAARTINSGQSCIAAKRFLVHEKVYEDFVPRFTQAMAALKVGDPTLPETQVGPLATKSIVEEVDGQVQDSVRVGAKVLTGGKRSGGEGYFYPPTVLADVPKSSRAYREEIFGPVATVFRIRSVEEALQISNDHRYGLASSVWTQDEAEKERFIRDLEVGQTFINSMVSSDPRLPFGGVKKSGYGRELSREGIREFVNLKTVAEK